MNLENEKIVFLWRDNRLCLKAQPKIFGPQHVGSSLGHLLVGNCATVAVCDQNAETQQPHSASTTNFSARYFPPNQNCISLLKKKLLKHRDVLLSSVSSFVPSLSINECFFLMAGHQVLN